MKGSVVFTSIRFECAAENCDGVAVVDRCDSVLATLDYRMAPRREVLPDNWQEIRGRSYCPKHDVEVTAMVRTPTLVRHGRGFVGGFAEELVTLQRSHIGDAVDAIYEGARKAAGRCTDSDNCTQASPAADPQKCESIFDHVRRYKPGSCL